jgi:GLPGLI family protein
MKMTGAIRTFFVVMLAFVSSVRAQVTQGKIVYERKTNLYKKFTNDWAREWIKEKDKIKVDVFELYFNDSLSVFKPEESDIKEKMSWTTSKNSVYQDIPHNKRLTIKNIWGEYVYVKDSLWERKWKITESKRTICGFLCRKAIWQANDTTRLYAWYCNEIATSVGPESFTGLPGAILGLATEDGGVIYFARKVELTQQDPSTLMPRKIKDHIYTTTELRAKFQKEYGKEQWGKEFIHENFDIW